MATGRTHQIRVHMTSLGHPLLGDAVYGRPRPARIKGMDELCRKALAEFPRQALHAYLLGFKHPTTGDRLSFESSMPIDISGLLKFLETM